MKPTQLVLWLSLLCLIATSNISHGDAFTIPKSTLSNDQTPSLQSQVEALTSNSNSFLSEDEAYTMDVSINQEALIVNWHIEPGYYLYDEQLSFAIQSPRGLKLVEGIRPKGSISFDINFNRDVAKHYQFLSVRIDRAQFDDPMFTLIISSQGCAEAGLCFPPKQQAVAVDLEKGVTQLIDSNDQQQTHPVRLWWVILSAILGGLILNLMPCVFPVLSLKALSFARTPSHSHKWQGISYSLGVLTTFALIGSVLLWLRSTGVSQQWGAQLQSPELISALFFLFAIMGLSFSGVVTLSSRFAGIGHSLTHGDGLRPAFFTGALAVVVASPCLGPFLGTAIGAAFTLPPAMALVIFLSLGLGMALPFLLLSLWPSLMNKLPAPGQWMVTFKHILAYPLYLSALWLLWVLGRQVSSDAVIVVLAGMIVVLACLSTAKYFTKLSILCVCIALSVMIWISTTINRTATEHTGEWVAYDEPLITQLRLQGKAMLINVTADWCITCLANDTLVFTDSRIEYWRARGLTWIKGDLTRPNRELSALLERHNHPGVPLYLLYPATPNANATVLPQILTPDGVDQALEQLNLPNVSDDSSTTQKSP